MFGLEKKDKKIEKFRFDLEVEIEENPDKAKKIIELCKQRIDSIKSKLKNGADPKSFDQLGILIHGYNALMRVIKKIEKKEATK